MRHKLLLSGILAIFAIGCKKDTKPEPTQKPVTEKTITFQSNPDGSSMYVTYNDMEPAWATGNVYNIPTVTQELVVSATTNGGETIIARAFLGFNLDTLPEDAQIVSAKLSLYGLSSYYTIPQGNLGENNLLIQRVADNWNQTTVNWNNQPSTTGDGQIELPQTTSNYNYNVTDIDVTSLVKAMKTSTPDKTGGFCLRLKNESTIRAVVFGSTRNSDATKRPKLVVVYKN